MASPTVSFHTLGCRLNQSESDTLAGAFHNVGCCVVEDPVNSDICVINTCSVTESAEAKCRNVVRNILRKSPNTFIVVTGCYAQVGVAALQKIPGIDVIAGTEHKMTLPLLLDPSANRTFSKLPKPLIFHTPQISRDDFTLPIVGVLTPPRSHPVEAVIPHPALNGSDNQQDFQKGFSGSLTRPNIKIQDGCDFCCTFCIIPFTRGRERSRTWNNVLLEASLLAAQGYQEIVLTGVNLGEYASDGRGLAELVEKLESVQGLRRIRISSIEPTTVPDRLLDFMQNGKLVPHLHLPLQSGSNAVLENMRRRYTREDYIRFVEEACQRVPSLCLGTDVMVGFPGEGEVEFNETVSLIESLPFAYLHVFPFSERKGTRVTRMGLSPVSTSVMKQRSRLLLDLSKRKREAFYKRAVGQVLDVLFECQNPAGLWEGLTGNYIRVEVAANKPLVGKIRPVRIESVTDGIAYGTLCPTERRES